VTELALMPTPTVRRAAIRRSGETVGGRRVASKTKVASPTELK
jgi:hypothetical protein